MLRTCCLGISRTLQKPAGLHDFLPDRRSPIDLFESGSRRDLCHEFIEAISLPGSMLDRSFNDPSPQVLSCLEVGRGLRWNGYRLSSSRISSHPRPVVGNAETAEAANLHPLSGGQGFRNSLQDEPDGDPRIRGGQPGKSLGESSDQVGFLHGESVLHNVLQEQMKYEISAGYELKFSNSEILI